MKKLVLFLSIGFSFLAGHARADDFSASHWEPGLHLFAGGGFNSSLYSSEHERIEGGVGLNLKTDLVYFFDENWAADWGSSVKFNRVDGLLIWDTQFTLGVRRSLPSFCVCEWYIANPYVRAFLGRSPTVIFLDGDDLPSRQHNEDINRIQYDGTVYGLTLGNMGTTKSGTTWFTELTLSFQKLEHESEIKMDGEVPLVVYEGAVDENSNIYTITFTVGALIF